jgi:hypothetical protein
VERAGLDSGSGSCASSGQIVQGIANTGLKG